MESICENGFAMEIDDVDSAIEELVRLKNDEDPFVAFVDYAKSVLSNSGDGGVIGNDGESNPSPGWGWIASRILKACIAYSSGVTEAILLSDLAQAWDEQRRSGRSIKRPECINRMKRKHKRAKLANTVTIDSIYEKNFLSLNNVLEAVVVDTFLLPGKKIHMLTLGDFWSSNTIELYLHRRYYNLIDCNNGILKKGREVFLTGCYLRTAAEGAGRPRLLPTEYLVALLDEDQDDDAMLLGAQFCSDSFSQISLNAANQGVSYSLYARIDSIGQVEYQGKFETVRKQQITLVDNDGASFKFSFWGDQIVLANLFSVGSVLALDRPFLACCVDGATETSSELCLEYGSATQLYLVPHIEHGEQVCVSLTQNRYQGSRILPANDPTQEFKVSQVTLRCNSQGTIDFRNYPFRSFVVDLRDKMTGISLYGVVTDIFREQKSTKVVFCVRIKDHTGTIRAKLHLAQSWSLERLNHGHSVYLSGLTCSITNRNCPEVSWIENDAKTCFVNLSCLPAVLTSPCLQKLSFLSDLPRQQTRTHICRVWLDQVDHCHVSTRLTHAICGHFVEETDEGCAKCNFCHQNCGPEVIRSFHLKITLVDESAKIFAWCTGHAAAELLQMSPDDFFELPEEEQIMYPSSLEHENFTVALVYCKRSGSVSNTRILTAEDMLHWEVTRALKWALVKLLSRTPPNKEAPDRIPDQQIMDVLPDHLIYDILLLTPVKSVLRFRSLARHWLETLSSQKFVRDHLKCHAKRKLSHSVITYMDYAASFTIYHDDGATLKLDLPVFGGDCLGEINVVSSCHGVLCLTVLTASFISVFLWNPITRQCKELSVCKETFEKPDPFRCIKRPEFAIGFDPYTDDYKVVRMTSRWNMPGQDWNRVFSILSVKTNVWKIVEDDTPYKTIKRPVSVDGYIYWLAKGENCVVLKFDLAFDKLTPIPCPPEALAETSKHEHSDLSLHECGGSIRLIRFGTLDEIRWNMKHVWLLEGDTNETWRDVSSLYPGALHQSFRGWNSPIGITSEAAFIVERATGMVNDNIQKEDGLQRRRVLAGNNHIRFLHCESLVSP